MILMILFHIVYEMNKLTIRKAKMDDLEQIQGLNYELFVLEKENYDPTLIESWPLTDEGSKYFTDMINNHYVIVAILNGEIVGYLAGSINEKGAYEEIQYGELNNMLVKGIYRGYGIGKKLIDEFKKYCKTKDISNIKVTASYKNKKAINFYEKNGFNKFNITLTMECEKFLVRRSVPDDAYGIAYVNAHTRYTTYKGLMPQELLETRINTIEKRATKVRDAIIEGKEYLVVENLETKDIVGMSIYGNSRNDEYPHSGEIYAIYILKDYQKLGLGKKLFFAGIECLVEKGYKDMIINVLDGNPTINFYKKYGGVVIGEGTFQAGDNLLKEKILFFENIADILKM